MRGSISGNIYGHISQLAGIRDEGLQHICLVHLGDGGVDGGQQALGVALGNSDAVGLRFTELGGGGSDGQIGVGLGVLLGDSAIEVKVVAKPAPVVKDHVYTWSLTVPASGKSVIDYTVEASAPEDMRLIYGR